MGPGPPTVRGGAGFLASFSVRATGHAGPGEVEHQTWVPVEVVLNGPDQRLVLAVVERVH